MPRPTSRPNPAGHEEFGDLSDPRSKHGRRQGPRLPPRRPALLALVAAIAVIAVLDRLGGSRGPVDAAACERSTLSGEVTHVRGGDTIEVAGIPIRLRGLAAPDWDEPGGPEATAALHELVMGRELRCELEGTRTWDRCVGVCYLDHLDIGAAMVRMGLARDCPRFSGGRYREDESAAAEAGAKLREVYEPPARCRASGRRVGPAA